jgi:hypothetical protein
MEPYSFDLTVEHQEKRQYIPQPPPVNKLNIGHCMWLGISSSVKTHLKQARRSMCTEYYGFCQGSIHISCVTPDIRWFTFIFAYNVIFYSCFEIKNGIFYSVLQYIGPAAEAVKYRYTLQFFSTERKDSLSVACLARSWDENLSEVHNSGKCVKLYPEQFNRFANEGNEMAFSMEIITV